MKKIVASVGLVALGASSVHAVEEPYMSAEAVRPWSVSATLRGFYDDNLNTTPSNKENVFGWSIRPVINFGWQGEQTTVGARYAYTAIYYDKTPANSTSRYDQNHNFNASLSHRFSERYQVRVTDSFVVGQEPDSLRAGDAMATVQRVSGDNIRNYGVITFDAQMTRLLGVQVGYANAYFDYDDSGYFVTPNPPFPPTVTPSFSGTLDRIEQTFHVDLRYTLTPETIGVVGYRYSQTDFTGNELIGIIFVPPTFRPTPLMSDSRNSRTQYGYVGADHVFNPDFVGSARLGFQYTDSYNDPNGQNNTSPYASASLSYTYMPESSVQAGLTYDWNATDVLGISGTGYTVGSQAFNMFGRVAHRIVPKLFANLTGQVQDSSFIGGSADGKTEIYYLVGLNLQYRFTHYLAAEVGYNWDKVDSQVNRSYSRNRVYVGVTGSY